jgi:predicted RNase H-like HicB family nuclease
MTAESGRGASTIRRLRRGIIESMLTRYIREAMKKARFKTLRDGNCFGEIPGLTGVWASEHTLDKCREVLQEVLEEWLVLKIRDNDPIPRIGRVSLPRKAA